MNTIHRSEILINATQVGSKAGSCTYEFVLNDTLQLVECVQVGSSLEGLVYPVANYREQLAHILFELNHVRVNPRIDNSKIIHHLSSTLQKVGVRVNNAPSHDSMALCFQPLGEITDRVRFYFAMDGQFIFLCPRARFTVIRNPCM